MPDFEQYLPSAEIVRWMVAITLCSIFFFPGVEVGVVCESNFEVGFTHEVDIQSDLDIGQAFLEWIDYCIDFSTVFFAGFNGS